ncbi:hypothetical protein RJ640_023466 [Escallonia rubra]|uniref:Probable glutathione S-transferase n=1 Tax=Escallonia rubra TaxID=112253 RepID=A0AA88USZ2_9ASTE|nr:hypothetical protein RJ640_023466 [Escallonia rubra]
MASDGVKLLGFWASPYALRVEWALKLKNVEYEYIEEDLYNKSPTLLQYNPVHKKVPVLVHDGKPIAESLVIIEYIDETWKQNPLLPQDPYERAKARFWAKFADEKCVPAAMSTFSKVGEEQEKAAKEARENMKTLESGLEGKRFFGGETIGFADIGIGWMGIWTRMIEEITNVKLIDEETMPLLSAWFQDFLEDPIIKERAPPRDKLLEHIKGFHKKLMAASIHLTLADIRLLILMRSALRKICLPVRDNETIKVPHVIDKGSGTWSNQSKRFICPVISTAIASAAKLLTCIRMSLVDILRCFILVLLWALHLWIAVESTDAHRNFHFERKYEHPVVECSKLPVPFPYALRVEWALKLKDVEYKYIEEDLPNKSSMLLQYNPVHKKVPVLVHDGKPVAESLVIIEYIDETWKQNPLLAKDPYERAKARFWAKFADEKCVPAVLSTFSKVGEEQDKAAKEARENLKTLESALEGKRFFGGEAIGFADIAIGWMGIWTRIVEEIIDVKLIDEETMPLLSAWFQDFLGAPIIKECVPPRDKLLEHNKGFHKMLTTAST